MAGLPLTAFCVSFASPFFFVATASPTLDFHCVTTPLSSVLTPSEALSQNIRPRVVTGSFTLFAVTVTVATTGVPSASVPLTGKLPSSR